MKIVFLRATFLEGQPVGPGDVAEVSDEDGRFLIGAKKAELADAPEKKTAIKATKAGKETATLPKED